MGRASKTALSLIGWGETMKKLGKFNDILNECLEQVFADSQAVDDCLIKYPEQAGELESLLHTALAVKQALRSLPDAGCRERIGYKVRAALRQLECE